MHTKKMYKIACRIMRNEAQLKTPRLYHTSNLIANTVTHKRQWDMQQHLFSIGYAALPEKTNCR